MYTRTVCVSASSFIYTRIVYKTYVHTICVCKQRTCNLFVYEKYKQFVYTTHVHANCVPSVGHAYTHKQVAKPDKLSEYICGLDQLNYRGISVMTHYFHRESFCQCFGFARLVERFKLEFAPQKRIHDVRVCSGKDAHRSISGKQ